MYQVMEQFLQLSREWLRSQPNFRIFCFFLAVVGVIYNLFYLVYELYFSPLSSIPGPWYAAISNFWLTTRLIKSLQCPSVDELFKRYGPIVRVGPKKVVFMDVQAIKDVYGVAARFDKGIFYKGFLTNNHDHAMSILEHSAHALRRRTVSPHYIQANLALFQSDMHDVVIEAIQSLESVNGSKAVNCLTLFRHVMIDINMAHEFGIKSNSVSKWSREVYDPISVAINDFPMRCMMRVALGVLFPLLSRVPHKRWQQLCDSDRIMAELVTDCLRRNEAMIAAGDVKMDDKMSMVARMLLTNVPERDIISEGMGHMIAGSDTTSMSTSYLCWELSRRKDVAKKLRAELDAAMSDPKVIPDIQALQKLPYLSAFIKEGLRLYAAAPSLLDRVVPQQADSKSFNLLGYSLPAGTVVATQPWSMHRSSTVFPDPFNFDPDRWLDEDNVDAMNAYMIPFGFGSRICAGQNVAMMVLRMVIAAVVRNFDVTAPPETNDKTMDMRDSFNIFPVGHSCHLIFTPRKR